MKYTWAYLCSDPRRLAITLRLLPRAPANETPLPGLDSMKICWCSHLDPAGRAQELMDAALRHAPSWLDYSVHDLSTLESICPKTLTGYFRNGKPRWALGVKLLLSYEFTTPFLYTDDDVLVRDDPSKFMINSFGTSGNFKFFKRNSRHENLIGQLWTLTGRPWPGLMEAMDEYDAHILDAGVFFVQDARHWYTLLRDFARLPYVRELDPESHEFRRLDQRFLTMMGIRFGWTRLHRASERRNAYSHPSKFRVSSLIEGTTFVHYKTGQYKRDWMDTLERYLEELKEA